MKIPYAPYSPCEKSWIVQVTIGKYDLNRVLYTIFLKLKWHLEGHCTKGITEKIFFRFLSLFR